MHKTGSYRKRVTGTILIFFLLFFSSVFTSFGADTVPVEVTAQYGQTEARTMLEMVNDFRTGAYIDGGQSAVWAYAQNGSVDTSSYTGLGELQYDYALEKVAMQRAMELVLQFDHERPDTVPESGVKSWMTLYPDGYSAQGENIAAGYGSNTNTAKKAFDVWCETNYPYKGQGHRRNMLGRGYNRIGVAHVVVHYSGNLTEGTRPYEYGTDIHYWIQEFGYRSDSFGLSSTSANDSEATSTINVLKDNIDHVDIETESDSLKMSVGESKSYDGASSVVRLLSTWPEKFELTWSTGDTSIGTYYVTAGGGYSLSIDDPTIASVNGNTITANKAGTTNLTITSELDSSVTKTVELTVEPVSLADANVTFNGSYVYSGTAQTPAPTVTLGGKTLIKDTDYSIVYKNNTDAGEATATITGKGNYKDSASGTFVIGQKPVSGADVSFGSMGTVFTYNGKVQKPSVNSVTVDSIALEAGRDYEVSAQDSINKGEYELTITGEGNYKGSIAKSYRINAKTLIETMADVDDSDLVYNGKVQLPAVSLSDADMQLTEGSDFTVEGEGGVNAGKYTLTVKGINNCDGSFSVEYEIGKAERPPVAPENNLNVAYSVTKISNSILNDFPDWTFASGDIGTELEEETPVLFHVLYSGSDAGNYANTAADINITRKACEHPSLKKFEEKSATCTEAGNSTYWQCSDCKRFFDSQDADKEIAENSWIISPHHTFVYYDEKTYCEKDGMAAHYECSECHKLFVKDGDEYVEKTEAELTIPGGHKYGDLIAEVPASCEADGMAAHYECSECHKLFVKDGDEYVEKTAAELKIAGGHKYGDLIAEVPASCEADGMAAHYECSECHKLFVKDGDEYVEKTASELKLAGGHKYGDLIAEVSATCSKSGIAAHYECSECHKLFVKNGDAYDEKTEAGLIIAATGNHTAGPATEENRVEETKDNIGHYDKVVYCSVCHKEMSRETIELRTLHDAKEAALADLATKESKLNEYDAEDRAELQKAIDDARTAIEDAETVDAVNTASRAAASAISSKKTTAQKAEEAAAEARMAAEAEKAAKAAAAAKAAEEDRQGIRDGSLPKVKIKKPAAKKTSIKVKWTKLTKKQLKKSKATHYEIWVSEIPGYPAGAATKEKIVKKSKSSWTCKGLKKNKKYYVKVRAIKYVGGKKHVGAWKKTTIKTKKK